MSSYSGPSIRGPIFPHGDFLIATVIPPNMWVITIKQDTSVDPAFYLYRNLNVDESIYTPAIFSFPTDQIDGKVPSVVRTDKGYTYTNRLFERISGNYMNAVKNAASPPNEKLLISGDGTGYPGYTEPSSIFTFTQNTVNNWNVPTDIIGYTGITYTMTNTLPLVIRDGSARQFLTNIYFVPVSLYIRSDGQCSFGNFQPVDVMNMTICNFHRIPECNERNIPNLLAWTNGEECADGQYNYCLFPDGYCGDNCKGPCKSTGDNTTSICKLQSEKFTCEWKDIPPEEQQWWKSPMFIGIIIGLGVLIVIIIIIIIALFFLHKRKDEDE